MWLILLAALQGYTPDPPAAKTVSDWLAVCDANDKQCADQLYDQVHDHAFGDRKLDFCIPEGGSPEATAKEAAAWLKAKPQFAAGEAWAGMNAAMTALHPCR
jgi:hypothetical protein